MPKCNKEPVYSGQVAKFISENGHRFNDAILVSSTNTKYPVNKVVLAVRSDFFKRLLLSHEKSSTNSDKTLDEFPLPTVKDEGLLPILHWLYHGEMNLDNVEMALIVLESAEFLGVLAVSELCQDWLSNNMDNNNVLGIIR